MTDGGDGSGEDESQSQSGDESQSQSSQQQSDRESESSGDREPSTAEKVVMGLSIGIAVFLFAYAGWQIATPPEAEAPQAAVVETKPLGNDSVAVTVELRNPRDVGLISATVQSSCTSPPTQVSFSFVPASSTRTGTLVCPPGTTDPSASLSSWVHS